MKGPIIVLTRISAVTALLSAILNLLVLLGWDLSSDQVAGFNAVIVAAGALVHSWYNPAVSVAGRK